MMRELSLNATWRTHSVLKTLDEVLIHNTHTTNYYINMYYYTGSKKIIIIITYFTLDTGIEKSIVETGLTSLQ